MTEPRDESARKVASDDRLLPSLSELAAAIVGLPFELAVDAVEHDRALQREIAEQLGDYVVPRLESLGAPLLVVVGGSTGAGKSTLVNSIVGRRVSATGVLRPTTRTPVLVHHPADTEWFQSGRILPDLVRTGSSSRRANTIRQVSCSQLWPGVAVLDAPDFDSIDETNRDMAEQLLGAADLWLFVTSAARYADQVPWDYLRRAVERRASIAVVLDRTSPETMGDVRRHLAQMLTERGLSDVALFSVPESVPDAEGVLPTRDVAQIVMWLRGLAADEPARRAIVLKTLQGAITHDIAGAHRLDAALGRQVETADQLRKDVVTVRDGGVSALMTAVTDGGLMRGEALARWRRHGRSSGSRRFRRGSATADEVQTSLVSSLAGLIHEHAQCAAVDMATAWDHSPAGRALLDSHPGLDQALPETDVHAGQIAQQWQECVFAAVSQAGLAQESSSTSPALALMVTVFGGDAADAPVRALVDQVTEDLVGRIEELFDAQAHRLLTLLPDATGLTDVRWRLRAALKGLDEPAGATR